MAGLTGPIIPQHFRALLDRLLRGRPNPDLPDTSVEAPQSGPQDVDPEEQLRIIDLLRRRALTGGPRKNPYDPRPIEPDDQVNPPNSPNHMPNDQVAESVGQGLIRKYGDGPHQGNDPYMDLNWGGMKKQLRDTMSNRDAI